MTEQQPAVAVAEIVQPGPFASIQDLGREGYAALGVPRSGAFDRRAARLANRLVGNPDGCATVEFTLGGLSLRLLTPATLAFTGAVCPGAPDWGSAITLAAGSVVRLGTPGAGLRSYLAVRGGFVAEPVLGSCSTDVLSGLGPDALRAGDVLVRGGDPAGDLVGAAAAEPGRPERLPLTLGPRADWFTAAAVEALLHGVWTVTPKSNRIGVRLSGPALRRSRAEELPSEPTLPGALQVPSDGQPIIFGPDAPVTGGYPVIAVLAEVDFAAQLRPGDTVRFTERHR